jgi:hypothetical protein
MSVAANRSCRKDVNSQKLTVADNNVYCKATPVFLRRLTLHAVQISSILQLLSNNSSHPNKAVTVVEQFVLIVEY